MDIQLKTRKRSNMESEIYSNLNCKRQRLTNPSSSKSLLPLPTEVMVQILSNLSTTDLLQNVALASNQFYKLTKCPAVHLKVSLSENIQNNGAIKFLKRAKSMTELSLTPGKKNKQSMADVNKLLLATCKHDNLTSIHCQDLCYSRCKPSTLTTISNSTWWRKVKRFVVDFEGIPNHTENRLEFDEAIMKLGSYGNLCQFSLGLDGDEEFVPSIHRLFVRSHKLKNLTIFMQYSDDEKLAEVFGAKKSTLESLTIPIQSCIGFGDKSIPNFVECQQLKFLNFGSNFDYFGLLTKLQNLTTIEIGFLDMDLQYRGDLPPNSMPNVTSIKLSSSEEADFQNIFDDPDNDFDEDNEDDWLLLHQRRNIVLVALAKACPNLKTYNIYSRRSKVSQEFFLDLVKNCTQIENFSYVLEDEEINLDESTVQVMIKEMTAMKRLKLQGWTLSACNLQMLLDQIKSLVVVRCNKRMVTKHLQRNNNNNNNNVV